MQHALDELDLKILNYILENEKLDTVKMATGFKTTQKTIYDRIARLKQNKVIEGVYAKINSQNVGFVLEGVILIKLGDNTKVRKFLSSYESANVTMSFALAGIYDALFVVKFQKPYSLSAFLNNLRDDNNVDFADLMYIEESRRENRVPFPLVIED